MNYTTSDYLEQLTQDRDDLVDNLTTKGITGLTGDETFTELVPEVLNISGGGGADLSDYFTPTISAGSGSMGGFVDMIKTIPSTTTVSGTSLSNAFYKFQGTMIPLINTSNVTNMSSMFNTCPNLTTIPLLDTSNVTNMSSMFAYCPNLTTIPSLVTSNVTNVLNMFSNCSSLTTVPIFNTTNLTRLSGMFAYCPSLTDTSLNNILQMCINSNVTTTSRKTLTDVGFTSTDYPASRIQALPHYQDFIDAGWTINY